MGNFKPEHIEELRKDLAPVAQIVSRLPLAKECRDNQIIVVQEKDGTKKIHFYSGGEFHLLTSTKV